MSSTRAPGEQVADLGGELLERAGTSTDPRPIVPVAIESASLSDRRMARRSGVCTRPRDELDRGGIVEVATGRDVEQQQVVTHQRR